MAGPVRLILSAQTAADLMTPNPLSIKADATVKEAIGFLVDRRFSAAPVVDEAGRPVGVVSQSDIVIHDRQGSEAGQRTRVRDIMTPVVLSVSFKTPARKVIEDLLSLKVHRLFVVDGNGAVVGVISTVDILRHLQPE